MKKRKRPGKSRISDESEIGLNDIVTVRLLSGAEKHGKITSILKEGIILSTHGFLNNSDVLSVKKEGGSCGLFDRLFT